MGISFSLFCSLVRTFITPAIVLHRTRYNDRYSIYHLYTLGRGRVGVLVPERTNKRNPLRELFRPLSELEVALEDNPKKELLRVQEARIIDPHHAVYLDAVKAAQAMFLSEFLYRVCLSPEVDSDLYRFLSYALTLWDQSQRSVANFHLSLTPLRRTWYRTLSSPASSRASPFLPLGSCLYGGTTRCIPYCRTGAAPIPLFAHDVCEHALLPLPSWAASAHLGLFARLLSFASA